MAARMAGVGRVTVSLRKSIIDSCMEGDSFDDSWKPTDRRPWAWNDLLSLVLPLLLILQVPAPFDLAKEHLAIGNVLETDACFHFVASPSPLAQEAAEFSDGCRIGRQQLRGFLNHLVKFPTMDFLNAVVHPLRITQLGQQIIDLLVVDGLKRGG